MELLYETTAQKALWKQTLLLAGLWNVKALLCEYCV